MAAGKRRIREISRAATFSGLIAMDSPSSPRMKRNCFSYSGFRIRAIVWGTPSFFATRQARILISSLVAVAISKSAFSAPASVCIS